VLAILSLASLILYPASILIPLGRLLSLVWIIATSLVLAQNGAKVTVSGRDEAAINCVVQEIQDSGGEAIGVAADLTDFAAVERMRRRVEEELDPVEVLAVFAGGQGYPTPTEQMVEEQWRSVIDSDLTATFLTVRSFLPGMITMKSSAYRPTVYVGEAWLLRRWRKTQSRATVGAGGGLVATGCHIEGSC